MSIALDAAPLSPVQADGTEGVGGYAERVLMPGGATLQYTKGRNYFGTDESNLEAKSVALDVRMPITEENERAKPDGGDPVLDAALAAPAEQQGRQDLASLAGGTWQWAIGLHLSGEMVPVEQPDAYTLAFAEDSTVAAQADCNQATGSYELSGADTMTITIGPTTLAACPGASRSEEFAQLLASTTSYQFEEGQFVLLTNPASGSLGMLLAPAEWRSEPQREHRRTWATVERDLSETGRTATEHPQTQPNHKAGGTG